MSKTPLTQPQLDAGFASRVLEAADRHRALRRRFRWLAGTSVAVVGIAATIFWRDSVVTAPATLPVRATLFAAASGPQPADEARDAAADPFSYMFPDAEPLARYAALDDADGNDTMDLFDDQQ